MLSPFLCTYFLFGFATFHFSRGDSVAHALLSPHSLQLHDFPTSGRGVQTTIDRSPGDVILRVPVNDTLTLSKLTPPGESTCDLYQLSEEQHLALALLRLRDEQHPYVSQYLPESHVSIWTLPPSLWNSDFMNSLPTCYQESFQATRDTVFNFAKSVQAEIHLDDALWAFSMVRSRSVAVPELAEGDGAQMPLALIPGLDLFNHKFEAGTTLQLSGGHWELTSSQPYKAGDQIFLSYGDDKDNWKLLLTYGFAVPGNPNSVAFWSWRDLLEAAGRVRPAVFTERVQSSLLSHPQLQIYTKKGEERATFSLDTFTGIPRESLKNGLLMLSSLSTQLGFPDDDTLQQDVLTQLVTKRVAELQYSLSQPERDFEVEWKPFVDFVGVALEEELNRFTKND